MSGFTVATKAAHPAQRNGLTSSNTTPIIQGTHICYVVGEIDMNPSMNPVLVASLST